MAHLNSNFTKGNEAFVAENYKQATDLYSRAIDDDSSCADYYTCRAHAYIQLSNYPDALRDADIAVRLEPASARAHLRRGVACFHLDRYADAAHALLRARRHDDGDDDVVNAWLEKCRAMMGAEFPAEETEEAEAAVTEVATATPPPPPPLQVKRDWYQTDGFVVVTVMMKKLTTDDVQVEFSPRELKFCATPPGGAACDLVLALAHDVVPEQSTFKVMTTKVELKMKKLEGLRWEALEAARDDTHAKQFKPAESRHGDDNDPAAAHRYPSASGRDWDKVARDMEHKEKDTKEEGEAALNQLFQQIYGEGSEEVKKAMNKSFVESGGTVLSTNWGEVGTKKIDVKPPDGMEYRKWDQ